jgi:hypothetical protein
MEQGGILCAPRLSRPLGLRHVFPQEDDQRPHLSANRRKPARGRGGAPADRRDAGKARGSASERAVGTAAALGGALRRQGDRSRRAQSRRDEGRGDAAHRASARLRARVGGDGLQERDRAAGECAKTRLLARARDVSHRAASPLLRRLGPRRRPLARGLSHRRRRGPRVASPLSRHGLARRGAAREPTSGRDAVRPALRQGCLGGGAVRLPARPSDHARHRVHGHHEPPDQVRGARAVRHSDGAASPRTIDPTSTR